MTAIDDVCGVIALNDNATLVTRIRLQKTFHLLAQKGISLGFDFDYHNYGPYSFDLADACDVAVLAGLVKETQKRGNHNIPYSVFSTQITPPNSIAGVDSKKIREYLDVMDDFGVASMELASTLAFLSKDRGLSRDKLNKEIKRLKPRKATDSNLNRAYDLLNKLNIQL